VLFSDLQHHSKTTVQAAQGKVTEMVNVTGSTKMLLNL
jgi:hypothetical protein